MKFKSIIPCFEEKLFSNFGLAKITGDLPPRLGSIKYGSN
jgi:hypothetical protein